MKYLLIVLFYFFTFTVWSKDIIIVELEERDGLYYSKLMGFPFSGESLVYLKNNQLSEKFNYKDGKLDGEYIKYYKSGQLEIRRNYKGGKLNGLCIMYYENGQVYKKSNWKDSKLNGEWLQYYKSGELAEKKKYKNGVVIKND
tara:strand:+ start:88 stop:516 length:429 start_codon:yes stop_codon:yes gene_type:complete